MTEIGRGEILEEYVVSENVGDVIRRGGEERVRESEKGERCDGGEIIVDGGREEERGEEGEIWEGREDGSEVEGERGGGSGGGEEKDVEEECRARMGFYYHCCKREEVIDLCWERE